MPIRIIALALVVPWMVLCLFIIPNYERVLGFLSTACLVGAIGTFLWWKLPPATRRRFWRACFRPRALAASLLITCSLTLTLGLLPSALRGFFPNPENHDEFSFLLGADTFLHGRLTNPTPPGWEHFESIHIILQPTYQSKFQPSMSGVLALGRLLTGAPYAGTLIALVLATAALTWMFHLWLPPRWRLPMACLMVFVLLYVWGDHYMISGPLAFCGGALQLALLGRFTRPERFTIGVFDGLVWGLALALLAMSRPFEGCIFSLLVGAALGWQVLRHRLLGRFLFRVLPPLLLVLIPAGFFQLHYNETLTGSRWKLPYLVHEEQYGIAPLYLFQPLKSEPPFRHPVIRQFQKEMGDFYLLQRDPANLPKVISFRFGQAWINFGLVLWLIPLLVLPELWRNTTSRWMLLLWCTLLAVMQCVTWFMPHYVAPAAPAWLFLIAQGIRYLRLWKHQGKPAGRLLVTFLVITQVSYILCERTAATLASERSWGAQRSRLQRELEASNNHYLILVRYSPDHKTGEEWVYNGGDIPGQRVIWARAMDPEVDRFLAWHYPEHQACYLNVDGKRQPNVTNLIRVQQHPPR